MPRAADIFDHASPQFDSADVVSALRTRGFCTLRNLFDPTVVNEIADRARALLASPAVAGVPGYSKVDHPKRLANPFVLGGPALDLMLDERVIDIVETVMDSECVLAEANLKHDRGVGYTYFPLHSDFSVGWHKGTDHDFSLTSEQLEEPVGIGAVLYLHDTKEGAFCYCDGTHHLRSPHGQKLNAYPRELREDIERSRVRCDGLKGDLVLFDDRGFHGPDHPSQEDRLAILLDYYRVATFGHCQVTPMPIWSNDIGRLTPRQLTVAGAGASYMVPYEKYMGTRFKGSIVYSAVNALIRNAFLFAHIERVVKRRLKRLVRRL